MSGWSSGFIKKSGAWFTYEGEQLGQGRENVKTFLTENPQLMAEIDERIREHLAAAERRPGRGGRTATWPGCPTDDDGLSLDDQPITLSE